MILRVECDANFGQKHFTVPSRQALFGDVLDLAQEVAHEQARFRVDARERQVVVLRFEVQLLLLREQNRQVRNDTFPSRSGLTCQFGVASLANKRSTRGTLPSVILCTIELILPSIRTETWLQKIDISLRTVTEVPASGTSAVEM